MTVQFLEFSNRAYYHFQRSPELFTRYANYFYSAKHQTFLNSGDLCRSPAVQSPDVLGQGSTNL
jgi:hypothetical protein